MLPSILHMFCVVVSDIHSNSSRCSSNSNSNSSSSSSISSGDGSGSNNSTLYLQYIQELRKNKTTTTKTKQPNKHKNQNKTKPNDKYQGHFNTGGHQCPTLSLMRYRPAGPATSYSSRPAWKVPGPQNYFGKGAVVYIFEITHICNNVENPEIAKRFLNRIIFCIWLFLVSFFYYVLLVQVRIVVLRICDNRKYSIKVFHQCIFFSFF